MPTRGHARTLQILVGCVGVVMAVAGLGALSFADRLPDRTIRTEAQLEAYFEDTFTGSVGWIVLVMLLYFSGVVAAGITWLVWQYRATKSVWDAGVQGMHIKPGWAVGWWFIPYANYVAPMIAMRELYQGSTGDRGAAEAKEGGWLVWAWWIMYQFGAIAALLFSFTWSGPQDFTFDPASPVPPAEFWEFMRGGVVLLALLFVGQAASAIPAIALIGRIQVRLETRLATWTPPRPDEWPV